ncbi:hypothetical protein [Bradyrhizobium sp. 141]|uniref:hypothetical protein n=1 Tax=Bradyrhizobium sp. 141 TaxID=2782617 RepID=UPI001FF98519|nr:hypothetical protein [Bradyrhizobium sp. 141]MCK1723482.1 hypothetical protein [Bradyrhizobium sp. 141]
MNFETIRQDGQNEFAMCTFAPGAANDAGRKDAGARAAASRQRQPDGLAVRSVSAGLARFGLIGRI